MQPLDDLPGAAPPASQPDAPGKGVAQSVPVPESGGPAGPEPTRYGDWERRGRCIDF
ncbi:MAG: succinate dehydrogenase assembly factor 4 [Steroidobacteraceae bacterium]